MLLRLRNRQSGIYERSRWTAFSELLLSLFGYSDAWESCRWTAFFELLGSICCAFIDE